MDTYEERLWGLVTKYTTQDIAAIMDSDVDSAGMLLMPVFAGAISIGHIIHGNALTDRKAFLMFAQKNMNIGEPLAVVLYDNVRDGLINSWCSQTSILLYANKDQEPNLPYQIAFRRDNRIVGINARALARLFVRTVEYLPQPMFSEREPDRQWNRQQVKKLWETLSSS